MFESNWKYVTTMKESYLECKANKMLCKEKKKELHRQFMLNALGDFEHMMLN